MTDRVIRFSPAEYINQAGILKRLPEIIEEHRYQKPTILTDEIVKNVVKDYLPDNLLQSWPVTIFRGTASYEEIERLTKQFSDYDVIVAMGGGQVMDTAKVVADQLKVGLINVQTVPSNCAAITTKSILYSEDEHAMVGFHRQSQAVGMVLLEPDLLKNAPYPYILSGIGDTLAKFYEIRLRLIEDKLDLVTAVIGRQFLEICRNEMLKVIDPVALEGQELTNFLDTIFLVAASVDGIADLDGRSVAAHAFYNAFVKIKGHGIKTHGELVALGILFQLHLEGNQDDYLNELITYYKKVGLPLYLSDVNLNDADLRAIADYISNPDDVRIQSIFPNISSQLIYQALKKLEK